MIAKLWEATKADTVHCLLCPHGCRLEPGQRAVCGVRMNVKGSLHTLVGDNVAAVHLDPVEKKPLYHFLPGSSVYSVGTAGCNLACAFCQNYALSRRPADTGQVAGKHTTPEILVQEAERKGAESIAFTYNEPTVFYELMYATATLARQRALATIMVSNGYQSLEMLESLYRLINAVNVDLKSFRDSFYRTHCKGRLAPVLDNLKRMKSYGWWVEVTTLLIPGRNDSPEEVRDIACFIRDELGPEVPWHISRFHGAYHWAHIPSTPLPSLERAWQAGKEAGLQHVYIGNAGSGASTNTWCPKCQSLCVSRAGYTVKVLLNKDCCPVCQAPVAGVWR